MSAHLFPARHPIAPRRVLAKAVDAGLPGGHFVCPKCDADLGWLDVTDTEIKRGVPCPFCNPPGTPGVPEIEDDHG